MSYLTVDWHASPRPCRHYSLELTGSQGLLVFDAFRDMVTRPANLHVVKAIVSLDRAGVRRADTYADVSLVDGADEMTITAAYSGLLNDSAESREQIEHLLFRRLNFIFHGGLIDRVPDASTNGKQLAVTLFFPADDIPPKTLEMLQEYNTIYSRQEIALRVIQLPRDVL